MGCKVDSKRLCHGRAICKKIVETFVAGAVLQFIDNGKPAVVENKHDQFFVAEY